MVVERVATEQIASFTGNRETPARSISQGWSRQILLLDLYFKLKYQFSTVIQDTSKIGQTYSTVPVSHEVRSERASGRVSTAERASKRKSEQCIAAIRIVPLSVCVLAN